MLPSRHRLRHEKDIKTLFAKGKSVFGNGLRLKIRLNSLPVSRFVVVVGVKIDKRAVVRNRLKRRVRAVIEEQLSSMRPGFDVSILPNREIVEWPAQQVHREVVSVLKKARIL